MQQAEKIARIDVHGINKHASNQGFSLIELMVAMIIGLVVSLAIYGVLTVSEGRKRTTTSINDIDQGGAYALYQLDKYIRSAGSGFTGGIGAQAASAMTYGCALRASRSGTQVLPASTFSAPFGSVATDIRLAPVVIMDGGAGAGGDVIVAMSGNGGLAEISTSLSTLPSATGLNLRNVAAFRANDIALVVAPAGAAMSACMLEQISNTFNPVAGITAVPLGGIFYQSIIAGTDITSYNTTAVALNMGQSPDFSMFGVGANNTLFRFNLLRPSTTGNDPNPGVFVEGVYQMQAVYGVNNGTPAAPTVTWVAPTGAYSMASLTAGTPAANTVLGTITAIKVGMVMRTSLPEKTTASAPNVSPADITLFDSTNIPITVTLAPRNYRYKVFEATIPIRNR